MKNALKNKVVDYSPEFLSGIAALVELPQLQKRLDEEAGLDTKGYISGYRGSPLGAYDLMLSKKDELLKSQGITFQHGLNEDLAATAVWGTQSHEVFGPTSTDGVFSIWYGKGPGVDRSGDVFRHANALGTHPLGGVVAIAGDDHGAQSSTIAHQTDGIFQSVMMPILSPSNVQELISYGLAGFALSRFSGLWTAMKTIAEVVESSAVIDLASATASFTNPHIALPAHGLNWDPKLSWPADRLEIERRIIEERVPAAIAWITHNRLNDVVIKNARAKLCIVTSGKAHQDVMQALCDLEIGEKEAQALGLGVFKYGVVWPVETQNLLSAFPRCKSFFIVEEKQPILENQIKADFYELGQGRRPTVVGKFSEEKEKLLPATGELRPIMVANAIVKRLEKDVGENLELAPLMARIKAKLKHLQAKSDIAALSALPARKPYFCAGCPHNISTKVPEGSVAGGGIGCHIMAVTVPDRQTKSFSHMGGEGMPWVGARHYSKTSHVFQNLGDGTYAHSGSLAIRAAVAENANITFKILYNDSVAMTGGQNAEGSFSPYDIARQVRAEGVKKIVLLSDQPEKLISDFNDFGRIEILHRNALDDVQRRLRAFEGVSVIIYVQTCATKNRRLRKRGQATEPNKRIFINSRVCEGCGDCSQKSNCIAVTPLNTQFGTKRQINQSSCNKDFSCIQGFCPSFAEVEGAVLKTPDTMKIMAKEKELFGQLQPPVIPELSQTYNVFVTGIGGLGVLTLGAILGAASRHDGKFSSVLDFTGLAQKNGAVVSHVRIAKSEDEIHAVRIGNGMTDLLIAADALVAAAPDNIVTLDKETTSAVVNANVASTADNVLDREFQLPSGAAINHVLRRVKPDSAFSFHVNDIAEKIFGDAIAGNIMMLGYAWQNGFIPLSQNAIFAAIKQNGVAVEMNTRAFQWGRVVATNSEAVEQVINPSPQKIEYDLDYFVRELTAYQDESYSEIYRTLVIETSAATKQLGVAGREFLKAVERNAFKVMAIKDEYEVARLYSSDTYKAQLQSQFSQWKKIKIWLAPPILSGLNSSGEPKKKKFGPWVFKLFDILKRFKSLRGSSLDVFGYTQERRRERKLRDDYLDLIRELNASLNADNIDLAIDLAILPEEIKGYGHVKLSALDKAQEKWARRLRRFRLGDFRSSSVIQGIVKRSNKPRNPHKENIT